MGDDDGDEGEAPDVICDGCGEGFDWSENAASEEHSFVDYQCPHCGHCEF